MDIEYRTAIIEEVLVKMSTEVPALAKSVDIATVMKQTAVTSDSEVSVADFMNIMRKEGLELDNIEGVSEKKYPVAYLVKYIIEEFKAYGQVNDRLKDWVVFLNGEAKPIVEWVCQYSKLEGAFASVISFEMFAIMEKHHERLIRRKLGDISLMDDELKDSLLDIVKKLADRWQEQTAAPIDMVRPVMLNYLEGRINTFIERKCRQLEYDFT